jgi:hypothetical protein
LPRECPSPVSVKKNQRVEDARDLFNEIADLFDETSEKTAPEEVEARATAGVMLPASRTTTMTRTMRSIPANRGILSLHQDSTAVSGVVSNSPV